MRTIIKRILIITLIVSMFFGTVACRKSGKKGNSSKQTQSTVSSSEAVVSTQSEPDAEPEEDIDETGEVDSPDIEYSNSIYVTRPDTPGDISTGIKVDYPESEGGTKDDDGDSWEDDIPDIDIEPEVTYEPKIMEAGTAASGNTRVINVDNSASGKVYSNFDGISCCIYPTHFTLESQIQTKSCDAYIELFQKRFNDEAPRYARSWFQIDWLVTNKIEESGKSYTDYNDDWNSNPDYLNYTNGIYDFDSEIMQSNIEYWRMLDKCGVEIYLAFGWKNGARIQNWFTQDIKSPRSGAPNDLNAYAKAATALLRYCKNEAGLTNVNILSFYNEPNWANHGKTYLQDFSTLGNKCVYWANMVQRTKDEIRKYPELDNIKIAGCDATGNLTVTSDDYVQVYLRNHAPNLIDDMYTFHRYLHPNGGDGYDYSRLFKDMLFLSNYYNNKAYVSEYYTADKDYNGSASEYFWGDTGWTGSTPAYFTAIANTGVHGMFKWAIVGGYLPDPMYMFLENSDHSSWYYPCDEESVNHVMLSYYQETMLNTYVKKGSNVQNIEWTGDDIRCSAFNSKDNSDFSLVMEVNEENHAESIKIDLEKSLGGKTVYVFKYDWGITKDGNATVPVKYSSISNVTNQINFTNTERDYCLYIFTTIEPLKQISLSDSVGKAAVYNSCEKASSVAITPTLLDVPGKTASNSTVEWEIKKYSNAVKTDSDGNELRRSNRENITGADLGAIAVASNGTVTYTPAADAEVGDVIALRCSLKSDKDRYAVAIVEIK